MHDLDRTNISAYGRSDSMNQPEMTDEYELTFELQSRPFPLESSHMSEAQELELASELLNISNEMEFENWFKGITSFIKKSGRSMSKFANSETGKFLRDGARKLIPLAGAAIGTAVGGPVGTVVGGSAAAMGSQMLGLELEGLSPEDQEFEVAKQLVRFIGDAAQKAAAIASDTDPAGAARTAMIEAAKIHAPGLLRPVNGRPNASTARNGGNRPPAVNRQGTWHYENGRIVLNGLLPN